MRSKIFNVKEELGECSLELKASQMAVARSAACVSRLNMRKLRLNLNVQTT